MKSGISRHLGFWVVYLFQDTLLHFTWMGPSLPNISQQTQVLMAIETAFITVLPKLVLVYYLLYIGGKKMISETSNKVLAIAELVVVICFSLASFRILFYYYINPVVYGIQVSSQPLFSLRSTLISFLELGFVAGAAIALKSMRTQLKSKEREKNLVKEKLETELKFLRNQMNPHFLMNTLNNIYALARKKSDDTEEVVMKFSELLRFILYEVRRAIYTSHG